MESPVIKRALVSVSNKLGIVDFALGLSDAGIEIVSTGGTKRHLDRIDRRQSEKPELSADQLLIEAGSVLACTMLMASGICGHGPGTFDSNTTLATLLPTIAAYRDEFYGDLLKRL